MVHESRRPRLARRAINCSTALPVLGSILKRLWKKIRRLTRGIAQRDRITVIISAGVPPVEHMPFRGAFAVVYNVLKGAKGNCNINLEFVSVHGFSVSNLAIGAQVRTLLTVMFC